MSEDQIPSYAYHNDSYVYGFFGPYQFLSNFYPCKVSYEGMQYPSVEHAFQAAKVVDKTQRKDFLLITAGQAKRLRNKLKMIDDWDDQKIYVMISLVMQKFALNEKLYDELLTTGSRHLEEANHWGDEFWGVNPKTSVGENWLGKVIMMTRNMLLKVDRDYHIPA